jgi:hypothetical protein
MYSLERQTIEMIEKIARDTRRDYSAVVDLAVEALARAYYPDVYDAVQPAPANGNGARPCE